MELAAIILGIVLVVCAGASVWVSQQRNGGDPR